MKSNFEENVYNAACKTIGEAVWQLVIMGEKVTQETVMGMILELSPYRLELAESIALTVLKGT